MLIVRQRQAKGNSLLQLLCTTQFVHPQASPMLIVRQATPRGRNDCEDRCNDAA